MPSENFSVFGGPVDLPGPPKGGRWWRLAGPICHGTQDHVPPGLPSGMPLGEPAEPQQELVQ